MNIEQRLWLPEHKDLQCLSRHLQVSWAAYIHWWLRSSMSGSIWQDAVHSGWKTTTSNSWIRASEHSRMSHCPRKTHSWASADRRGSGSSTPQSDPRKHITTQSLIHESLDETVPYSLMNWSPTVTTICNIIITNLVHFKWKISTTISPCNCRVIFSDDYRLPSSPAWRLHNSQSTRCTGNIRKKQTGSGVLKELSLSFNSGRAVNKAD